jgi:Peptidase family M23
MLRSASACALTFLALACGGGSTGPDPGPVPTPSPTPAPPPVLSVPVIDLGRVVTFIPFGARLDSGVQNPTYELRANDRTLEVRAATAGIVISISARDQLDFELHVRPTASSDYLVIYDHVREPRVAVGATVQAGDPLGLIGNWSPTQGRTELQINRRANPDVAVCPRDLGTPSFNAAHDAALAAAGSSYTSVCLVATVQP